VARWSLLVGWGLVWWVSVRPTARRWCAGCAETRGGELAQQLTASHARSTNASSVSDDASLTPRSRNSDQISWTPNEAPPGDLRRLPVDGREAVALVVSKASLADDPSWN